jgi:hypothetical protein
MRPSGRPTANLGVYSARLLLVVAVLATTSCSSDALHPVRGKVVVGDKPAAGAVIMFHPDGGDVNSVPATAVAAADGSFTLATGDKPGARAGKYVVTVVWPDPGKKPTQQQIMMGLAQDAPDVLGGRFATKEASRLRAEVVPGPNNLEPFDLK